MENKARGKKKIQVGKAGCAAPPRSHRSVSPPPESSPSFQEFKIQIFCSIVNGSLSLRHSPTDSFATLRPFSFSSAAIFHHSHSFRKCIMYTSIYPSRDASRQVRAHRRVEFFLSIVFISSHIHFIVMRSQYKTLVVHLNLLLIHT